MWTAGFRLQLEKERSTRKKDGAE